MSHVGRLYARGNKYYNQAVCSTGVVSSTHPDGIRGEKVILGNLLEHVDQSISQEIISSFLLSAILTSLSHRPRDLQYPTSLSGDHRTRCSISLCLFQIYHYLTRLFSSISIVSVFRKTSDTEGWRCRQHSFFGIATSSCWARYFHIILFCEVIHLL